MSIIAPVLHALATPLGIAVILVLFLVFVLGCARLCLGVLFQVIGLDDEDSDEFYIEMEGELST